MSDRSAGAAFRRMPYVFGPPAGPRQGPSGEVFDWSRAPRKTTASVSFLTTAAALDALLPPGLQRAGAPVVTIEIAAMTELEWLAGRGYSTFGVRFPAHCNTHDGEVVGSFLTILWENLADPIISGREELGFSKLYCELPPPRVLRGTHTYEALWMGHKFFRMQLEAMEEVAPTEVAQAARATRNDGLLHYKYMPRTGAPGVADAAYITFTPATGSKATVDRAFRGRGKHAFTRSTWEELPTMFHIINAFEALPVLEWRDAWIVSSHGGKDLGDQRILEVA